MADNAVHLARRRHVGHCDGRVQNTAVQIGSAEILILQRVGQERGVVAEIAERFSFSLYLTFTQPLQRLAWPGSSFG